MKNEPIVDLTTKFSIYAQFIVGMYGIDGLRSSLAEKDMILHDILVLESIVQVIELGWYYFILQNLPQEEMAKNRYYDWVITTPIMLITIFSYLLYEDQLENKPNDPPLRLTTILRDHKHSINKIIISNYMMLSLGYLYETGKVSKEFAFIYGFVFLIIVFDIIYKEAGCKTAKGKKIVLWMFLLWSVYGIAFMFPTGMKNSIFNITDLFSKNFFQVYITNLIHNKKLKIT